MPKRQLGIESGRRSERGISLFTVAASMVVILGLAALGIDLASFYLVRSEAQRAADAAALAGATVFVISSCTNTGNCSTVQTQATSEAITVGNRNMVGGQNPNIQSSDVTFDTTTHPNNPLITVNVQMTSARGLASPTFFGKIFGINTVDISATATAEAYHPVGGGPQVGTNCVKPWLLPNCDPTFTSPGNGLCGKDALGNPVAGYYVDPTGTFVEHPQAYPSGVIDELLIIKPGSPGNATAASQFFPVILPPGTSPAECPACSTGGGTGGASLYRQNIECCNTNVLSCGSVTLQPETGDVVGPTRQGVDCLIHQGPGGTGQDILDTTSFPYTMKGGSNNPITALRGRTITSSDSLVTMPIYDGQQLCPGKSCPASVNANIVGFMQIFIKDETNPQGTVEAYILNVTACGSSSGGGSGGGGGGGGGGGVVVGGGLSPVPIRLVHP